MRKVEKKSTIVVGVDESLTRLPMCAVGSSSSRTVRKHPVANATKLSRHMITATSNYVCLGFTVPVLASGFSPFLDTRGTSLFVKLFFSVPLKLVSNTRYKPGVNGQIFHFLP
jgi:hypothetical protein